MSTQRTHAAEYPQSGAVEVLGVTAGLALLCTLLSLDELLCRPAMRGAVMWIKLIGLLFAGVFVGATIYEVSHRRRAHREKKPSDQPNPEADESEDSHR